MIVAVMGVGKMGMGMRQGIVMVPVPVKGIRGDGFIMGVEMMFIMVVFMIVRNGQVDMGMLMTFGQVQSNAKGHKRTGGKHLRGQRIAHDDGQRGADKGCDGKIRAGARGAQMAQCDHIQRQAHAVCQKPERQRADRIGPCGQGHAGGKGQRQIHQTGDQSFDGGNPGRIGQ